jgi:hypothetical protein
MRTINDGLMKQVDTNPKFPIIYLRRKRGVAAS